MLSIINKLAVFSSCALAVSAFSSCQKMERPEMIIIPDDTARINGPLQLYLPFEDSALDSAQYQKASTANVSYTDGVRGRAYQGASNAIIQYPLTRRMAEMESFTISFWMNTSKHTGGAQSIFVLPNTEDFWGNMFAIIEGNGSDTDNSMELKFNFSGNWVEFSNRNGVDRLPDMYGSWHHLAFTYDGMSSIFSTYLDGEEITLPEAVRNRTSGDAPLGPLQFQNPARFVIGAFQQHAGISGGADSWMLRFTGALDQFRVYTEALDEEMIKSFYDERQ